MKYNYLFEFWTKEEYNKYTSGVGKQGYQEWVELDENNSELAEECLRDYLRENGDNPDEYIYKLERVLEV